MTWLGRAGSSWSGERRPPCSAFRIEAVANRDQITVEEASRTVKESDDNRKRYHQQYYARDWNDASNYHLVLNAALLGVGPTVELVVSEARKMWGAMVDG